MKKLLVLPLLLSVTLVGCYQPKDSQKATANACIVDGKTIDLAPEICARLNREPVAEVASSEPENKVQGTAEEREQAQQWLDSANNEPTWSGAQFNENQRQAWAECEKNPAAEGC